MPDTRGFLEGKGRGGRGWRGGREWRGGDSVRGQREYCACACVCLCVRACVCACVCAMLADHRAGMSKLGTFQSQIRQRSLG